MLLFDIISFATILSAILISIIVVVALVKTIVSGDKAEVKLVPLAPFVDPALEYGVSSVLQRVDESSIFSRIFG